MMNINSLFRSQGNATAGATTGFDLSGDAIQTGEGTPLGGNLRRYIGDNRIFPGKPQTCTSFTRAHRLC